MASLKVAWVQNWFTVDCIIFQFDPTQRVKRHLHLIALTARTEPELSKHFPAKYIIKIPFSNLGIQMGIF